MLVCGCMCAKPAYEREAEKQMITTSSTTSTLETRYNIINVTKEIIHETNKTNIITLIQYQNVTADQYDKLMNLRQQYGESPAYSAGFYECKDQALDIMDLKTSKFSEKSPNYLYDVRDRNDSLACFEWKYDGFTDMIDFDKRYWENVNVTDEWDMIRQYIVLNKTYLRQHNATEYDMIYSFNDTVKYVDGNQTMWMIKEWNNTIRLRRL